MNQTDETLKFDGCIVQSWYDMRSEGVWVIMADNGRHITGLFELLNGSDTEHAVLKEYLLNEGAWLSVALAPNLESAMQQLEEKIQNFKDDYEWANDVYAAFEQLIAPYQFKQNGIENACNNVTRRSIQEGNNSWSGVIFIITVLLSFLLLIMIAGYMS